MHYALIRPRKGSSPDSHGSGRPGPHSRPRQAAPVKTEQTVGERLRAKAGAGFGPAWLARELGCSADTAAELAGYWIPQGPPHLLEQTLNVFANALDLNAQRLQALIYSAGPAPRHDAPAPSRFQAPRAAAQPRQEQAAEAAAPRPAPVQQAEISIGSAEGVRVVKQRQPTIVYRKTRKFAAQAEPG